MNTTNHKALGRYCYGGKIYLGQCKDCGQEHYLDVREMQEAINNSYLQPQSKLQQKLGRVAILAKAFSFLF